MNHLEGLSRNLFWTCPRQAVGLFAGVDLSNHFERLEIDHDDFIGGSDGHEGARAVGRDQDSRSAATKTEFFHTFASGRVEHHKAAVSHSCAQSGYQDPLAVWRKLQPVGMFHGDGNSLDRVLGGDVNDGYRCIARVGSPDFFSVGRDVEAFNALASRDVRDFPGETRLLSWATRSLRRGTSGRS